MITLGKNTYNILGDIDCYWEVNLVIGNYCSIGSGLKIISGQHPCVTNPEVVSQYPFKEQWKVDYPSCTFGGNVTIGNDVWIGSNVRILDGVTIGDGSVIGAETVVGGDIEPYSVVVGNPARVVRKRFSDETINELLDIKWWLWEEDAIKEAMPYMKNITDFIKRYSL